MSVEGLNLFLRETNSPGAVHDAMQAVGDS